MELDLILNYALPTVGLIFGLASGLHAILNKRNPRAQLNWLLVSVFVPFIGAIAYWSFGVNRIRTRARKWHEQGRFRWETGVVDESVQLEGDHPANQLEALLKISARVTGRALREGNRVTPLYNGEQAYPDMLGAIAGAKRYIYLCTYIFETTGVGREFIDALGNASERGVQVWVLIDAIGERYARPRLSKLLREYPKVRIERFLPISTSLVGLRVNLRNHRKVMSVDGTVGFTGGMNIGPRHLVGDSSNDNKTTDLHFKVEGPAIFALEQVFLEDWWFTLGEHVAPPGRCEQNPVGRALCRGIKDGPNEDFEALQWILVGAMGCAQKSIAIITPYFIPNDALFAALNAAVLRGVRVQIILPEKNNLPFVGWATQAMLGDVIAYGVEVRYQPPPFAHTKLLMVDDFYVNLGSANLDPRSLRLNFEFNLEVYDTGLAHELRRYFDDILDRSVPVTAETLAARSFSIRLRDAWCKLFAPYL